MRSRKTVQPNNHLTRFVLLKTASRITPQDLQPLELQGQGWVMELQPYAGVVVEWRE